MNGWQALGFKTYKDYLESDIWISVRNYYLSQHPICEECGRAKATQVHHLNYNTVGNEGEEDLQAVCKTCHEKITKEVKNGNGYNKGYTV